MPTFDFRDHRLHARTRYGAVVGSMPCDSEQAGKRHAPEVLVPENTLSVRLGDAGRRDEGLAAIHEAVTIRRRLAAENAAAYEPDLAISLHTLSI